MGFSWHRSGLFGALALGLAVAGPVEAETMTLRFSTPASPTEATATALEEIFAPAIADFATFEPHYSATLFKQGTEIEGMARGTLDMGMPSAQEIASLIPAWSIFTAGYLLRDAEHQKNVFESDVGDEMKKMVEDQLGVKLLSVFYLGRRQLDLKGHKKINTPEDLAGVNLRMPGSDSWQFLGRALGANPTPLPFTEVYTALQTGAIDGQDNPLPTDKDAKFYEVTDQIVLTSHLVDMNILAISLKDWNALTPEQQQIMQDAADKAADRIREVRLKAEDELVAFFRGEGLDVYTPDVDAFRTHVQKMYLESDMAKDWPEGMVDRINAVQ